jgi:hypothetical protein
MGVVEHASAGGVVDQVPGQVRVRWNDTCGVDEACKRGGNAPVDRLDVGIVALIHGACVSLARALLL